MRTGIFKVWVTFTDDKGRKRSFAGEIEAESLAEVLQIILKDFGPNVSKTIVTPQRWVTKKEYRYGT